ncbi:protein of unknown function [Denitratisoma oestradiolicum]|uniref:Uncharacterized protein n=1 Tax=Denitratisoma oestradiolicum TaxID=311182 RepID=A0A6S6XYQ6_9PROT|nr:protein of unknown function [Denitratisoma oestradiolicum]
MAGASVILRWEAEVLVDSALASGCMRPEADAQPQTAKRSFGFVIRGWGMMPFASHLRSY